MNSAGHPAGGVDAAETEWQFDALDLRPVLRWLDDHDGRSGAEEFRVAPAGSANQIDLYLDTDDQRFYRAGYSLRIRRVNRRRHGEATLKALASGTSEVPGLRDRREVAQHLDDVDVDALQRSDGPVGERVRAVAGRKQLLRLFEVRTNRHTFSVSAGGVAPGEVALDETRIQPGDGSAPARLRRVEVEVPASAINAFVPFVEGLRVACALRPAELSKYEAGLLAVDLREPQPESFGLTATDPEGTIGALALNVLRRHFETFLAHEPGTRLGDDPEELHDMRVACRRLRAAVSLFGDVLAPSVLNLREELKWIGGVLGDVRDLDVQLEELEDWQATVPEMDRKPLLALRSLLAEQRAVARAWLLESLDSRRYESFVNRFSRALRARPRRGSGPWSVPAREAAPDLIQDRYGKFRKAARRIDDDSEPDDYHRLRIRGKRLRYTLEFLCDLYPDETKPIVKRLTALQDILGEHHDAVVAIERLRDLAAVGDDRLTPPTAFAMGEIAERYRRRAAELEPEARAAYKPIAGKRWKALKRQFDEQQPETQPQPPLASSDGNSADYATTSIRPSTD
jgi:CHAD domain-containing protein